MLESTPSHSSSFKMSVLFHSSESEIKGQIAVYQEFNDVQHVDAAADQTPKPKLRHVSVVLLSFGLLCVLQGILNISLRLGLREPTGKGDKVEESCPQDWVMFGSSCYYISSPKRRSWESSRADCVQRGADLVIIDSRQEQAFLSGFSEAAWVGMTDREREGTWLWVDGTPVNDNRVQWALGQPDESSGGEDCGELRMAVNFIGLNDLNCRIRAEWICEKTLG